MVGAGRDGAVRMAAVEGLDADTSRLGRDALGSEAAAQALADRQVRPLPPRGVRHVSREQLRGRVPDQDVTGLATLATAYQAISVHQGKGSWPRSSD